MDCFQVSAEKVKEKNDQLWKFLLTVTDSSAFHMCTAQSQPESRSGEPSVDVPFSDKLKLAEVSFQASLGMGTKWLGCMRQSSLPFWRKAFASIILSSLICRSLARGVFGLTPERLRL